MSIYNTNELAGIMSLMVHMKDRRDHLCSLTLAHYEHTIDINVEFFMMLQNVLEQCDPTHCEILLKNQWHCCFALGRHAQGIIHNQYREQPLHYRQSHKQLRYWCSNLHKWIHQHEHKQVKGASCLILTSRTLSNRGGEVLNTNIRTTHFWRIFGNGQFECFDIIFGIYS